MVFNGITKFIQSPDRTKVRVKRDDLDTLSEVWTGPVGGEDGFVPAIGCAHWNYNLMTLVNASTKQLPGLVVEVTLNYHGKLVNSGTGRYTSVPTVSRYWQEGEISYENGYYTYSHRYTGRCVTIAFITNAIPSGNESNLGLAKEFLGFTNEWKQLVSINPGGGFTVSEPPIKKMTCTDVRIEDQGDGWYKVTETYMSRMFPGTTTMSTGAAQAAPPVRQTEPMTIGAWFMQNLDGSVVNMLANPDRKPTQAVQAKAQDQETSYTPPSAPTPGAPVTTDQVNTNTTGIPSDANAGAIQDAIAAASNSAGVYSGLGGADGAVSDLLDF